MRMIIYAILLIVLFIGCAPKRVPIVIDTSTLEELPKEMALEYLRKLGAKHPSRIWYKCVFYDDHIGFVQRTAELRMEYEDAHFVHQIRVEDGPATYFLELTLESGFTSSCAPAAVYGFKDVNDPEIRKTANKVATALKSLGVKIEEK